MRAPALLTLALFPLALLGTSLPAHAADPETRSASTAGDPTIQLLEKLANAPGPPGAEEPVRAIMVDEMKPYSAPIR